MSDLEKYQTIKQNKRILKEQKEAYSLWCTELYRLSIANKVFNIDHKCKVLGS